MTPPKKFDPRRQSIEQLLEGASLAPAPELQSVVAAAERELAGQRDLDALRRLTTLFPPSGGMRYDADTLLSRAQRRMEAALRIAARIGSGTWGTVLEVGCGRGENARGLPAGGPLRYIGLDINARFFPEAQAPGTQGPSLEFIEASAASMPLETGSIDLVVSFNVMEHVGDPPAVMGEIARVLRPGGVFFTQFGPPWHSPFGPHLTRASALPHLHHLFPEDVVATFLKREDAYYTVNRQPVEAYRRCLWQQPALDCAYYWEYLTLAHAWAWPHFLVEHRDLPTVDRIVNRIDAGLVRKRSSA